MDKSKIAELVANILYIDDPKTIDTAKSLFRDYGMSSIDYIDFSFELQAHCGSNFSPDELWPVNSMLTDPAFFVDGKWTVAGEAYLRDLFQGFPLPASLDTRSLYTLFSIDFVASRLTRISGNPNG
jgi:acyl carrier protein